MEFEIIGLTYRSVRYLDSMVDQVRRHSDGITFTVVANDPTDEIVDRLNALNVPHKIYYDPSPSDYYMRRVYRCINWMYEHVATKDFVIEVQSDMAFSRGWAWALVNAHKDDVIPVSRLCHPFHTPKEQHSLVRDFGYPGNFKEQEWEWFARAHRSNDLEPGGFYIPRLMDRKWFLAQGGFPEGNLRQDGGISSGPEDYFRSSDEQFFAESGKLHVTVFNSLVYHMGEGEMLDK